MIRYVAPWQAHLEGNNVKRYFIRLISVLFALALALLPSTAAVHATPLQSSKIPATGDRDINVGDRGDDVEAIQKTLTELHYYHGAINGLYADDLVPAVWAFQKVQGIGPSKTIDEETREALQDPKDPKPFVRNGEDERVEIDLTSQLMQIYSKGEPVIISHISSGSGEHYCSEGRCRYATTPTGEFSVYKRVEGWESAALGEMYRPLYFYGGWAIHGSIDVPLKPASHGCIRVPMSLGDRVPDTVGDDWPVYVL